LLHKFHKLLGVALLHDLFTQLSPVVLCHLFSAFVV
jgi:hypothetical protein